MWKALEYDLAPHQDWWLINSAIDRPSNLDYEYEAVFWWLFDAIEKKKFPINNLHIPNQWDKDITKMSCTRQSVANITNWNNILAQWVQDFKLAENMWIRYLKENPQAQFNWASVQSWLKQAKNDWFISWYSAVRTIDDIKNAIDNWRYIATWSNNWDWTNVRTNHTYKLREDWRLIWHAFCMIDYIDDRRGLKCINSYWEENWEFEMSYDLVHTLYTRYAVSDKVDTEQILLFKEKIMEARLDVAKERGYWNWERPDDPITRKEVMYVLTKILMDTQPGFKKDVEDKLL